MLNLSHCSFEPPYAIFNPEHPLNTPIPTLVTLTGIVTLAKFLQ